MENTQTLDILKQAFLMEKKGKRLYDTAAEQATDERVKAFFNELAEDETQHMEILALQFRATAQNGHFSDIKQDDDAQDSSDAAILDQDLISRINAAGFEATAITAAIAFEEKAVRIYSDRAKTSDDPQEKKMYQWLAAWEQSHLNKLTAIEENLHQAVWNDNQFWPF